MPCRRLYVACQRRSAVLQYKRDNKSDGRLKLQGMNIETPRVSLAALQAEQNRLRIFLAVFLLAAVSLFALVLSWLGQRSPLQPLLMVKTSLFALLSVYTVGIGVAWIYARWIRVRREPSVREFLMQNANRNAGNDVGEILKPESQEAIERKGLS